MRIPILLLFFFTSIASADDVKIVLWNGQRLFDVEHVNRRTRDLRSFGERFRDADILILNEVTSLAVVGAMRDRMGFSGFHTACCDFAQNDSDRYNSLEVGFISRFPLSGVTEYDPSPDNTGAPGEPAEEHLVRVEVAGIADVATSRGFLAADVPAIGVTLIATHLKSARGRTGEADHDNAMKREFVAAAIADLVARRLKANPAATVLVAGDMNVGETDTSKNGYHLLHDHYRRREGDLYDDTQAIFSAGLIRGVHMASLTRGLGTETYDDPQFAGAGPIDCIYVLGRQAGDFTLGKKNTETFGSDHFAVFARFLFSGTAPKAAARRPVSLDPFGLASARVASKTGCAAFFTRSQSAFVKGNAFIG